MDVTLKFPHALSFPPRDVHQSWDFNYCVNRKDCGREMTFRAQGSS